MHSKGLQYLKCHCCPLASVRKHELHAWKQMVSTVLIHDSHTLGPKAPSILVYRNPFLKEQHTEHYLRQLTGALSPVNHKELHQGWMQTSFCLSVILFTSHDTTSRVFSAYLYSTGTRHGNLHPAGWPILFCGPTQEPVLATANRKNSGEVMEKMQVNGLKG